MVFSLFLRCFTALLALVALPLLSACGGGTASPGSSTAASVKLVKPADCGALEQRLKSELARRYDRQYDRYLYLGGSAPPTFGGPTGTNIPSSASGGDASLPHSETNVQEKGVDEGDLVKTDGTFIYLARGSHFLVLRAQPPEQSAIVSDIDLNEPISELHLAGGRVTLITIPLHSFGAVSAFGETFNWSPVTRLRFYDVTTPGAPALTARYDFPGYFQGSRRIGDTIYLVTNHSVDLPNPVSPWDYLATDSYDQNAFSEASALATAENLKRIESLPLADLLPTYSRTLYAGGVAGATEVGPAVDCGDLYVPESGNGTDLSLVFAIDAASGAPAVTSTGVLSSWCRIYMSPESLYLASGNDWLWIEPASGADQLPANPEPWTAVHKFAVAGAAGKLLYSGSGLVNGWLNDQFSMGEYNGCLRIGTTRGGWWGEGISNQLAILAEQDGTLVETGKIEGLAPGEQIYAMRFDRDRGYMVTFRQTDPLFTFDLSDPNNPRQAGEIKVDGFATYIHLIGENNDRLLTVGRSADAAGRVTGNKLQLFDVTTLANPQLVGEYELGAGWSGALYDHHAFLYYAPLSLLAIPYYGSGAVPAAYDSGLRLFTVDGAGITARGVIPATAVTAGYGPYPDTVDRSVVIGADIYTIAHRTVTVAGIAQLDIKKVVGLPEGYWYYPLMATAGIGVAAAMR